MATEIQNDYAEIIYEVSYDRCSSMERQRIDTMIERKSLEELNSKVNK